MTTATGAQPTNSEYYGNTYVPYPLEGIKDEHSMMQPTIGRPKPNKVEFQNNTDKRFALVLVLDKSNSMSGEPARLLNEAVAKFKSNLMEDIDVARRIDVAVVQFNHRVWLHTFRNTEVWQPPVIQPEGGTCLSAALNIAIDLVTQRSDEYRMNGISYYRPWIVLLADRYPEQDQEADLTTTGVRVRQAHDQKKFNLFAITCGDANETTISLLREKITPPGRPPKKTTKTNFSELFQWLSRSLTTVTRNTTSDRISLADTSGWEIVEKPNERIRLVSTPKANGSGFHDTEDERRSTAQRMVAMRPNWTHGKHPPTCTCVACSSRRAKTGETMERRSEDPSGGVTLGNVLLGILLFPLGAFLFIAIPWSCGYLADTAERHTRTDQLNPMISQQIVSATNRQRAAHGLPTLAIDQSLTRAAQRHSVWMGKTGKYGHTGAGGSQPWDRTRQENYGGRRVAENIMSYQIPSGTWPSAEEIVTGWMNSPGHRENILDGQHAHIGVGTYRHNGITYSTQNFGSH